MYYIGSCNINNNRLNVVFYNRTSPTKSEYPYFNFITGGFKTKNEAENNAHYTFSFIPVYKWDKRKNNTDLNLYLISGILP